MTKILIDLFCGLPRKDFFSTHSRENPNTMSQHLNTAEHRAKNVLFNNQTMKPRVKSTVPKTPKKKRVPVNKKEAGIVTPKPLQKRTRKNGVKFRDVEREKNPAYEQMNQETWKYKKQMAEKKAKEEARKKLELEKAKKLSLKKSKKCKEKRPVRQT